MSTSFSAYSSEKADNRSQSELRAMLEKSPASHRFSTLFGKELAPFAGKILEVFKAPKADASTADASEDTKDNFENIDNEEENSPGDADVDVDETENESEGKEKSNERQKKAKEITTVRYDKHSLPNDEICDPPRLDDVITCDVVQSRRSGAISVTNVRIVERKSKVRSHGAGKGNVGVVADVNESRHFGFIDIVDDHA